MLSKDISMFKKRSCKHKHKHLSLKDVLKGLFRLKERGWDVDSCYKCVFCGLYHIGHYGKKQRRSNNRRLIKKYLNLQEGLKCH